MYHSTSRRDNKPTLSDLLASERPAQRAPEGGKGKGREVESVLVSPSRETFRNVVSYGVGIVSHALQNSPIKFIVSRAI